MTAAADAAKVGQAVVGGDTSNAANALAMGLVVVAGLVEGTCLGTAQSWAFRTTHPAHRPAVRRGDGRVRGTGLGRGFRTCHAGGLRGRGRRAVPEPGRPGRRRPGTRHGASARRSSSLGPPRFCRAAEQVGPGECRGMGAGDGGHLPRRDGPGSRVVLVAGGAAGCRHRCLRRPGAWPCVGPLGAAAGNAISEVRCARTPKASTEWERPQPCSAQSPRDQSLTAGMSSRCSTT